MRDLPPIYGRIADRVRGARMRFGLTEEQVAARLGVTQAVVSDIESGRHDVSAAELVAMSRLFGEPLERLLGLSEPGAGQEEPTMHASAVTAWNAQLERWMWRCEEFHELERELGSQRRGDLRPTSRLLSSFEEAEALADEERSRLALGPTPAHVLLGVLEERLGIKVSYLDLDDEISGASVVSPRFGPAVLVNGRHAPGRRVFTLAHQLFHLLVRGSVQRGEIGPRWRVCAGQPYGETQDRIEQMADRFAGRLLLPPGHLRRHLRFIVRPHSKPDAVDLIDVARYFGVSVQVVCTQFDRPGRWSPGKGPYLNRQLRESPADRTFERGPEPQRLRRLGVRAYLGERISRARLAELLGITVADVDDVVLRHRLGVEDHDISAAMPCRRDVVD